MGDFAIGTLAKMAGVGVETVRYYQRRGLLPEPPRPYGGIRRYGARDAERIGFIKTSQHLGFSLAEIAELLRLADGTHCEEAAALAGRHLTDIQRRLRDLRRMEATLVTLLERCRTGERRVSCPLIDALRSSSATKGG